jgi:hypothetical protein
MMFFGSLGQALHTFEDFRAHTNYIKPGLREDGLQKRLHSYREFLVVPVLGEGPGHVTQ